MIMGGVDYKAVNDLMEALSKGIKKAEIVTSDGRKITAYYVGDRQIRIDIIEANQ